MNIVESPNDFIKEDRVDYIFLFLSGNISQELINYLSTNIKHYQIKNADKIVLFYSKNKNDIKSEEQIKKEINWEYEYKNQSDIFTIYFSEPDDIKSYYDLGRYIKFYHEIYKENLSDHILIGYKEGYKNSLFLKKELELSTNGLISPIEIKDISVYGDLILKMIEKLYIQTDVSSLHENTKVRPLWPAPKPQFTIGILGKSDIGKQSILRWFIKGGFTREFITYGPGTDTYTYEIEIKNKKYIVNFQFPAGQERYDSYYLFNRFILNKNCFIFTFDITDKKSFDDAKNKYYKSAKSLDIKINHFWVLVGNKSDLRYKRSVKFEEADSFADENKMKYFEVSVKSGENMEHLFDFVHSNLLKLDK